MPRITIRKLDAALLRRLRKRAEAHGRSVVAEVREILRQAVGTPPPSKNLGRTIHARFAAIGGVELDLPPREVMREPPYFS